MRRGSQEKAQRLEVEDAMTLTLQQNGNGFELPDSFSPSPAVSSPSSRPTESRVLLREPVEIKLTHYLGNGHSPAFWPLLVGGAGSQGR